MKALIFDCDGTLVHTQSLHLEAMQRAGIPITREFYADRAGLTLDALLLQLALDPETTKGACARYFLQELHRLEPNAPVAEIAREHAGRVPMAVASNGHRDLVEATLAATGLRGYFETVVTIDDVIFGKPEPDVFLEAARRLGVAPSDCLIYEDSDEGLEAARRAGIPACDVRLGP